MAALPDFDTAGKILSKLQPQRIAEGCGRDFERDSAGRSIIDKPSMQVGQGNIRRGHRAAGLDHVNSSRIMSACDFEYGSRVASPALIHSSCPEFVSGPNSLMKSSTPSGVRGILAKILNSSGYLFSGLYDLSGSTFPTTLCRLDVVDLHARSRSISDCPGRRAGIGFSGMSR